jgi:hypothetical protein
MRASTATLSQLLLASFLPIFEFVFTRLLINQAVRQAADSCHIACTHRFSCTAQYRASVGTMRADAAFDRQYRN